MIRSLLLAACAVICLAACGSKPAQRAAAPSTPAKVCKNAAAARARIRADIAAMREAARRPTTDRLQGNRAVNVATDRFLNDVALAPIGNLERNRMIDHAAGTLAGACEQCFQALEASRPIVNIRRGELRC